MNKNNHVMCRRKATRPHLWQGILGTILLFSILVTFLSTPQKVYAVASSEDGVPYGFDNNLANNALRYAYSPLAYLNKTGNGYMVVILTRSQGTLVKYYDANFHTVSEKRVALELPVPGTFLNGQDGYYYILSGQENKSRNDSQEVMRLTRYDHSWNRLASVSLYGSNIAVPFDFCNVQLIEYNGYIVGEMGFSRYDGHQQSFTFEVDASSFDQIQEISNHYVSHCLGVQLGTNGKTLIAAQLGDGYPREIIACKLSTDYIGEDYRSLIPTTTILQISGQAGNNFTGTSIGGISVTDSGYLLVGNTVDQSTGKHDTYRDIFTAYVPFATGTPTLRYITRHASDGMTAATPQLVTLPDGRYLLMWTETDYSTSSKGYFRYSADSACTLHYLFLDAAGTPVSSEYTQAGITQSSCPPLVTGDKVIWYRRTNDTFAPPQTPTVQNVDIERFYSIDLANPSAPCETIECSIGTIQSPYTDVKTDAYYYDALLWAGGEGITSGTSDTTFSPNAPCTRGQMAQFLYKMNGAPDVSGTLTFTDVSPTAFYRSAVIWAVQNGITSGTSDTTFGPNSNCKRAQMVQFLYKMSGSPAVSGELSFTDVPANAYYHDAVLWAVQNGITNGTTDTTFGPNDNCSRGQMVQFLYKLSQVQE